MVASGDYYATLEVRPDADDAALRRAYRAQMRLHHPDVSHADDAADHCHAINEAYACLRDPVKRAAYDARRRANARAGVTARRPPTYAFRPGWGAQYAERSADASAVHSKGWKAASIGGAIVVTIITFAITSAVDRRMRQDAQAVVVTLKADRPPAN